MSRASRILLVSVSLFISVNYVVGQRNGVNSKKIVNTADEANFGYHGPIELGPLSINNRVGGIEFDKLLPILTLPTAPSGMYVCFHNVKDGTYLVIERGADDRRLVRGLTLSRINICPEENIHKLTGFSTWATEKGIRLGSAVKDVLSKYGEPSSVWDTHTDRGFYPYPREGDHFRMKRCERILVYLPRKDAPDTSHAFFGILNGVVVWMTLSANE